MSPHSLAAELRPRHHVLRNVNSQHMYRGCVRLAASAQPSTAPLPVPSGRGHGPAQEADAQSHHCLRSRGNGAGGSATLTLELQLFTSLQPSSKGTTELSPWVGRWRRLSSYGARPPWTFPAPAEVSGQLGLGAPETESSHHSGCPRRRQRCTLSRTNNPNADPNAPGSAAL